MRMEKVEIKKVEAEVAHTNEYWKAIAGMVSFGNISINQKISQEIVNSKGDIIDDSKLLMSESEKLEERLTVCIPRTVSERKIKANLLTKFYEGKQDVSSLSTEITNFCDAQIDLDDEQKDVVMQYFVLLELLGKRQEHFSIEEMKKAINDLRQAFVNRKQAKYLNDNITEVFRKFGYNIENIIDWQHAGKIEVEVEGVKHAKCYVTYADGGFLLESVGIVSRGRSVSNDEQKSMLNDQYKLCSLSSQIEQEALKRGINCRKIYNIVPKLENMKYELQANIVQKHLSSEKNNEDEK